jgi:hypothetical protein
VVVVVGDSVVVVVVAWVDGGLVAGGPDGTRGRVVLERWTDVSTLVGVVT